jgi:hypothetical protein
MGGVKGDPLPHLPEVIRHRVEALLDLSAVCAPPEAIKYQIAASVLAALTGRGTIPHDEVLTYLRRDA